MGKDLQALNSQNKLALWAGQISECRSLCAVRFDGTLQIAEVDNTTILKFKINSAKGILWECPTYGFKIQVRLRQERKTTLCSNFA